MGQGMTTADAHIDYLHRVRDALDAAGL